MSSLIKSMTKTSNNLAWKIAPDNALFPKQKSAFDANLFGNRNAAFLGSRYKNPSMNPSSGMGTGQAADTKQELKRLTRASQLQPAPTLFNQDERLGG